PVWAGAVGAGSRAGRRARPKSARRPARRHMGDTSVGCISRDDRHGPRPWCGSAYPVRGRLQDGARDLGVAGGAATRHNRRCASPRLRRPSDPSLPQGAPPMSTTLHDYTEILVRRGSLSDEQLAEAMALAARTGMTLRAAITRLGYATPEEICRALAEAHGLLFVNLT